MERMNKHLAKAALLTGTLAASNLSAWDCCIETWNDLSISGGWRCDKVRQKNQFSVELQGERVPLLIDKFKASDVNIWEVGGQLWVSPSALQCCFDCYDCCCWYNSFFIRGNDYWGWVTSGQYKNFKPITQDINKAKTRGTTFDGTVGLGFLIPFCICDWDFAIGPVGGYAYDSICFDLRNTRTDGTSNSSLSGADYNTRWQGGWLGVDYRAVHCICGCDPIKIEAGYEYHWACFTGKMNVKGAENFNQFDFNSHSSNGWGQLVYLNTWWNPWCCFDIGLGFKYQWWKAHGGKVNADVLENIPTVEDRMKNAKWTSFAIHLDLGYHF